MIYICISFYRKGNEMKIVDSPNKKLHNFRHQEERENEIKAFWECGAGCAEVERFDDVTLQNDKYSYTMALYDLDLEKSISVFTRKGVIYVQRIADTKEGIKWNDWCPIDPGKEHSYYFDLTKKVNVNILFKRIKDEIVSYVVYTGFYDFDEEAWFCVSPGGPIRIEQTDDFKVFAFKQIVIPRGLPDKI